MSNPRFNGYSSSVGGGSDYSSTQTPPSSSGQQYVDYSSQGTTYVPPAPTYTSTYIPPTSTVYHTQTSSNLFNSGGYHTRRHHDHGTQHVDEVRYDPCCRII